MICGMLALTGCLDFSDATQPITATIQVQGPEGLSSINLAGHQVTISGPQTLSATTDEEGIAVFQGIIPDVYNISIAWKISAEEYTHATGKTVENKKFTISGNLTAQPLTETNAEPITLSTNVSQDQSVLISKIYYQGSKDDNGKNYVASKYLELYNNSDETIDIAGLYIALLEADNPMGFTLGNVPDSVFAKQVFRIPTASPFQVAPGATILLVNSAVDHAQKGASHEPNLIQADFEAKDYSTNRPHENNAQVTALEAIYLTYSTISYMNLVQGGPCGVIIFDTDENPAQWNDVYKEGRNSGAKFKQIPTHVIIDAVEILRNRAQLGPDPNTKRLYDFLDAGYTHTDAISGYDGYLVYRKTASITDDGRRILMDTNNSSNDFDMSNELKPREYK